MLTALKRLALPPELLMARPKRLRFLIFNTPGKLVHHARSTLLRLGWSWQRFSKLARCPPLAAIAGLLTRDHETKLSHHVLIVWESDSFFALPLHSDRTLHAPT